MANCSKLVGQLPKNDVCLTQCYQMVQKENVVSMIAENVKVHIGPRLLPTSNKADFDLTRWVRVTRVRVWVSRIRVRARVLF